MLIWFKYTTDDVEIILPDREYQVSHLLWTTIFLKKHNYIIYDEYDGIMYETYSLSSLSLIWHLVISHFDKSEITHSVDYTNW